MKDIEWFGLIAGVALIGSAFNWGAPVRAETYRLSGMGESPPNANLEVIGAIETNSVKIGQPVGTNWPTLKGAATNDASDFQPPPPPKIEWLNNAVYYATNNVWDDERNLTNKTKWVIYTKDVITTNKVASFYVWVGGRHIELGFRNDGVIVWRNRK